MTYKILTTTDNIPCGVSSEQFNYIPLSMNNSEYQRFLDDINEHGIEIVEGDLPESVLQQAADRKFNKQLIDYLNACNRLAQYILSEGRPEVKEMIPSGDTITNYDTGVEEEVLSEQVTQTAIDPLPEMITITNEDGSTEEIRNPAIVQDEEQRAAAQAIVDATPQEVKDAAK